MTNRERRQPKRRAACWLAVGLALLVLCGGMAAFLASAGGSASSVVPNPRGQPDETLAAAGEGAGSSAGADEEPDAVDWEYWRSANPDIIGWVSVDGTAIDYAVAQAPDDDPTHYLDHDAYRSWNPYGCPYVDAACDGFEGACTVVFGHNMGFGATTVFADFARYSDEAFARSHPTITLATLQGVVELEVSAADVVVGSSALKRTDFSSPEEMRAWYEQRFSECDVQIANNDKASQLFVFVTCSYTTYANERTLVYAQPSES